VKRLAPDGFALQGVRHGQGDVARVHPLHAVVQRHIKHARVHGDRQGKRGGQAQDRPLKVGCSHELLALDLVLRVVVGGAEGIRYVARRLLILRAPVDVQRGSEDQAWRLWLGLGRGDEVACAVDIHSPGPVRLPLRLDAGDREVRDDESEMHDGIAVGHRSGQVARCANVAPDGVDSATVGASPTTVGLRGNVEGAHVVIARRQLIE